MNLCIWLGVSVLWLFGGRADSFAVEAPGLVPSLPSVTLAHGDHRVGTYVSGADAFRTNSFWIEGADGLVVIDTQFTPSSAQELVDWAEQHTGKRVRLAVILHANPDKFNGTQVMQQRGIRVITSRQIADLIPAVHELRKRWFYERWKPDYPETAAQPEVFGDASTTLHELGLNLRMMVLGVGCSEAHLALEWEGHLFVGDLVANQYHAWMELGQIPAWRARLHELQALKPTMVHPGRGVSGGPELLEQQDLYLERVATVVADHHPQLPIDDAVITQIQAQIEAAYPGYGYAKFLEIGLPAVYQQQAELLLKTPQK